MDCEAKQVTPGSFFSHPSNSQPIHFYPSLLLFFFLFAQDFKHSPSANQVSCSRLRSWKSSRWGWGDRSREQDLKAVKEHRQRPGEALEAAEFIMSSRYAVRAIRAQWARVRLITSQFVCLTTDRRLVRVITGHCVVIEIL